MDNTKKIDVIIVGGGPAGLTLAYYLQEKGVNYAILEKGAHPGESWRTMPEHLHLISLWKSNALLPKDLQLFPAYKAHSALEFATYLDDLVKRQQLNFFGNQEVTKIEKAGESFVVQTQKHHFTASIVVDCRGYYSFPFTPEYPVSGQPPFMVHFKDFKNANQFKDYKRVCIVGKRLSAGQIIKELADSDPQKEMILSARSQVTYGTFMGVFNFILRHLDLMEIFLKKFTPIKKTVEIPMHRNIKEYVEKRVKVCPDIASIVDKKITFVDGSSEIVDAIIFTTGFKRAGIVLRDDFEDKATDGLFYLGINAQRTFTSRFLRGIREDAPILAQLIFGKVASKKSCQ